MESVDDGELGVGGGEKGQGQRNSSTNDWLSIVKLEGRSERSETGRLHTSWL